MHNGSDGRSFYIKSKPNSQRIDKKLLFFSVFHRTIILNTKAGTIAERSRASIFCYLAVVGVPSSNPGKDGEQRKNLFNIYSCD